MMKTLIFNNDCSGLVAVLLKQCFLNFRHHEMNFFIEGICDGFWILISLTGLQEDSGSLARVQGMPTNLVLLDKISQFLVHWCEKLVELPPGLSAHLSMGARIFHCGLFGGLEAAGLDSKTLADELKCLRWVLLVLLQGDKCELRGVVLLQPLLEVTCIHRRPVQIWAWRCGSGMVCPVLGLFQGRSNVAIKVLVLALVEVVITGFHAVSRIAHNDDELDLLGQVIAIQLLHTLNCRDRDIGNWHICVSLVDGIWRSIYDLLASPILLALREVLEVKVMALVVALFVVEEA